MNINVDNIVVGKGDNVVVLARPDGKPIALVSGDVVTADVLDIISSGLVMLRITPPAGKGEGSGVLLARTDVPLSEGDRIALKVLGGDKDISLKFMGIESSQSSISTSTPPSANAAASTPVPAAVTIEQRIQGLLTELAGARLTSTDFQALQKVLTNIPASVKDNYPEFKMLASLAANMEQLNEQSLRASVEGSGVLFETNMKQAAVAELNYAPDVVTAKNALNAVVQQAIEAFQYPQTEAHTRAFLSDLISVTSQGIQGMDSNNARDTLNQLKQAIADCISVVETEKSQHSSCNCSDVLAAVKQQLDSAGTPQPGVPKDGAAAAAQIPQRVIIDGSEVLIPQKLQQQQPGDAVTPQMATTKDGVAAAVPQIPQRIIIDGSEVLIPQKQQQPGDAITPQMATTKDGVAAAVPQIPQRIIIDGSEVLIPQKQQPGDAITPQMATTKDGAAAVPQIPQRVIIDGSEVLIPQKQQQQPGDAVTPQMATTKDGVAAVPQIPQRIIIDGSEVLIPQKQQQQPGDAITPQMATTKDGVVAAVPQIPQRIIIDGSEVLIPQKQQQQPGDAVTPQQGSPKDGAAMTILDQGRPQRIVVEGGDVLAAVRQKPDDAIATPRDSIKDSAAVAAQTATKDAAITPHSSPKSEHVAAPLNVNNDQKALLLKIKNILQDDKMVEALKNSPAKRDELLGVVDKFIKNIEFYQVSSRANDMVGTYLPFLWNELRDGELLFKKNKYHAKKSFTCDINLDLDRLGKISASVTAADGGFFVSFNVEKDSTKQLIMENKGELEKRFAANGLTLKVINIGQKTRLDFAENNNDKKTPSGGLDLRI